MRREGGEGRWGILPAVLLAGVLLTVCSGTTEAGVDLVLKNNSFEDISVAINYLAPNGRWITRGWWDVPSGKSIEPNINSENSHFYFYAEGDDGGRWSGEKDSEGIVRWVVDEKFEVYDDQDSLPSGSHRRKASFFHSEAEEGSLEQTFND